MPQAPSAPAYSSSTSTTITLTLSETTDNGGSQVTEYKLFRDGGDLSTDIVTEITAYDG